eukprot:13103479-Ditylum_brightwellii.AAC.1
MGKLQHASYGIPGGAGLFFSIANGHEGKSRVHQTHPVDKRSSDRLDFPGHILEGTPHIGPSAWTDNLQPLVWQIKWPPEVRARIHSTSNPEGNIYINDLELKGM